MGLAASGLARLSGRHTSNLQIMKLAISMSAGMARATKSLSTDARANVPQAIDGRMTIWCR
jgi:hypothetical protein